MTTTRTGLNVLVVDDEPDVRAVLRATLADGGHDVTEAGSAAEAMALTAERVFDVVLTDVVLPGSDDGIALFRHLRHESPSTDVILMTGYASVSQAVAALKEGARDYLTKPIESEVLCVRLDQIAEQHGLKRELEAARSRLPNDPPLGVYGSSPSVVRLLENIDTVAMSEAPVLIHGESGTGKELVARTLHAHSSRRNGPFIAVNCASIPETLLEAELFGHERGAFTGAVKRRDGRFRAAHGGTLLLDEVAEVPLSAQAKLLRVLQEGTVERLGADMPERVDVRVISATHRNLRERIAAGAFREDLFYRLHVLDLHIPPLRERRDELPLLVRHFLETHCPPGAPLPSISPRAWAAIEHYHWPGNVRELAHAIQRAVVLTRGGDVDLQHLPSDVAGVPSAASDDSRAGAFRPLAMALREYEREHLRRALELADGKRVRAAELLGISRKNLWEKLRNHQLSDEGKN